MEYLKVWTSFRELLEPLTDAEKGRLFVSMLEYAETGTEPHLSGNERYVWPSARQSIKRASDENERMKAMGKKGGRPKAVETYENLQKPIETCENPYKEKDKEKDNININNNDSARAHEEDTPFGAVTVDPLIIKIQQELNGLTDTHYRELDGFRDELPDDLISYAIDSAVGNGVRNWNYVRAILQGYVRDHVRSVGEAKAKDEERSKQKAQKTSDKPAGKVVSAQRYTQREYDEHKLEEDLGLFDIFKKGAS